MREDLRESRIALGCFELAGHLYALDVGQIREVVRWQQPTPLPNAPPLLEGLVDVRDLLIPVVDLGVALRSCESRGDEHARIAIVDADGMLLGLIVDAAVEVLEVDAASLQDPPALAVQAGSDAVRAVVRRKGRDPILVLSLEHILERIYRSGLSGGEE